MIERNIYQHRSGGKSIVPLDQKWQMENEFARPEVREAILFNSALLTPGEVHESLKRWAPFKPSTTAIENIINETGEWIDESFEEFHPRLLQEGVIPQSTNVFVASYDGVNILLDEKGKRKGRPAERPGFDEQTNASSYRNATVGAFSFYNSSEDDLQRLSSQYIARSPEYGAGQFKIDFEREFAHWDSQLDESTVRIFLADGATGIWNYVDNQARYDNCYKLIDFYHASEHLSLAAEAIFGKKSQKGKDWYRKWVHKLKHEHNAVEKLIRSILYYAEQTSSNKRKSEIQKQLTYFQHNSHRMNYSFFVENSLPIGSGVVEAACKSVVKTRLCRSGMRWSRKGAQNILHLRAILKSKRWDEFWKIYNAEKTKIAA
jgi:hypothetical protein